MESIPRSELSYVLLEWGIRPNMAPYDLHTMMEPTLYINRNITYRIARWIHLNGF